MLNMNIFNAIKVGATSGLAITTVMVVGACFGLNAIICGLVAAAIATCVATIM